MHSAKGLEWRAVYVLHATDGKIPHERSFMDPEQLEEERRMFYVAMTRAADWLYICHPRREAAGYGNAWMGNAFETTTLTRFIGSDAKRKFQCQTARNFRRPTEQGDEAPRRQETQTQAACYPMTRPGQSRSFTRFHKSSVTNCLAMTSSFPRVRFDRN
jgi:ATP-dependent exoDNAse (exonuclease V) beta subunit